MLEIVSFYYPLFMPEAFDLREITQRSPNNMGVSFINKKAPVRRLFDPQAFHTGIYTVLSHKQKNHIEVGFILDGYGNFRVEWRG